MIGRIGVVGKNQYFRVINRGFVASSGKFLVQNQHLVVEGRALAFLALLPAFCEKLPLFRALKRVTLE